MNLAEYVDRLEKMLTRYADSSCGHCPAQKRYDIMGFVKSDICKMCQDFVGLSVFPWPYPKCPCHRPNPEEAVARAWAKIREYREKQKQ